MDTLRTRKASKPTKYDTLSTRHKYSFHNIWSLNASARRSNSVLRSADFDDQAPRSWLADSQDSQALAREWQKELELTSGDTTTTTKTTTTGRGGQTTAKRNKPSLLRAIWRVHGASYLVMLACLTLTDLVSEPAYFYLCVKLIEIIGDFIPTSGDTHNTIQAFSAETSLSTNATMMGAAAPGKGGESHGSSVDELYTHAMLFLAFIIAYQLITHPYAWLNHKMAVKIRVALSEMIYKKSLVISRFSRGGETTNHEQALSLISRDLESLEARFTELSWVFSGPLQCLLFTAIVSTRLDVWTTLVSCLLNAIASSQRGFVNFRLGKYSRLASEQADKRLGLVSETLDSIRLVRMYAWTRPIEARIEENRHEEIKYRKRHLSARSLDVSLFFICAHGASVLSLLFAHYVRDLPFTQSLVSQLFLLTATYRRALSRNLAQGTQTWAQTLVSIERCQKYLTAPDKPLAASSKDNSSSSSFLSSEVTTSREKASNGCSFSRQSSNSLSNGRPRPLGVAPSGGYIICRLEDISLVWRDGGEGDGEGEAAKKTDKKAKDSQQLTTNEPKPTNFCLQRVSLTADEGELVLVAGQIGSGKSSLLQLILGELEPNAGSVSFRPGASVAYAGQNAWIFSGTVRENVILGRPFNLERYYEVLRVCALLPDLEIFPDFDRTRIGERGVTLSGGQKARVNLARALYQQADLYLLDDPLSAVDGHVSSHIFTEALRGFLRGKSIILVTHQVQYLSQVDKILYLCNRPRDESTTTKLELDDDQRPNSFFGTYEELKQSGLLSELLAACMQAEQANKEKEKRSSLKEAQRGGERAVSRDWAIGRILSNRLDKSLSSSSVDMVAEYNQDEMFAIQASRREHAGRIETSKVGRCIHFYAGNAGSRADIIVFILVNILLRGIFLSVNLFLNYWAGFQIWRQFDDGSPAVLLGNKLTATIASQNGTGSGSGSGSEPNWFAQWVAGMSLVEALGVTVLLFLALVVVSLTRAYQFFILGCRASIRIHRRLIHSLLWTRLSFFDRTPQGHVINRLAADVDYMDSQLVYQIDAFSVTGLSVAFVFLGIVSAQFKLALVVAVITYATCWLFKYLADLMELLKHLDGFRRSQVYSHIYATLDGLPAIRSSKQGAAFVEKFTYLLNRHTSVRFLMISVKRLIIGSIDWMLNIFYTCLVVFTVSDTLNGQGLLAFVGLNLVVQLTRIAQNTLLIFMEFYLSVQSMDRIRQYSTELEHERIQLCAPYVDSNMRDIYREERAAAIAVKHYTAVGRRDLHTSHVHVGGGLSKEAQFTRGAIEFSGVSLKFLHTNKLVLNNISFKIEPGCKVGIIGRTGAGKSSLATALFHLYHFEGLIFIDGQDTKEIQLESLRGAISIIPQDPCLFTGSIRHNLDPFEQHSDEKLWRALEMVQLKQFVLSHPVGLEMFVDKSGANFSIGQRQLVCLARAILKDNKILVMDEATSNIDQETDALIQAAIKSEFKHCTVLTIAHRLSTVVELDKLMIMQEGRVVEFGTPLELLERGTDGLLSSLIDSLGERQATLLRSRIEH